MEIAFKNKRIITNIALGLIWIGIGISYFFESEKKLWKPYVIIALGIAYIIMASYEYFYKYLIISDKQIQVNIFPKKQINIDEITSADYNLNDYTFTTSRKTLKVVRSRISPDDLPKFETFFNEVRSKLRDQDPLLSYERK